MYGLFPVFLWVSIAVQKQYDHCKHLLGAGFQFKRFSPLWTWQKAGQYAYSHGIGKGAKSPISGSKVSKE